MIKPGKYKYVGNQFITMYRPSARYTYAFRKGDTIKVIERLTTIQPETYAVMFNGHIYHIRKWKIEQCFEKVRDE